MPAPLSNEKEAARQQSILQAAQWCFLNFGYAKTSLEDIAKRANLSRTLLYRTFKDKEAIFTAVFAHWLIARHPEAKRMAAARKSKIDRLIEVCRLMVLEPWMDMVSAPMGTEFFEVCERIDPEIDVLHRKVALECVTEILQNTEKSEVFLLSLHGLLEDQPEVSVLEHRLQILCQQFVGTVGGAKR
jgi:AcrR family transcriptional regulator